MSPIANPRVIFKSIPTGEFTLENVVYEPEVETIDLESVPLDGGVLVRTLYLSLDPYLRGRMRDKNIPSYVPALELGEPMEGPGIGVIIRSEYAGLKAGDHIMTVIPWKIHSVLAPASLPPGPLSNPLNLPWPAFLGVAGLPGQSSYYSTRDLAKWKKGETLFVTTAAGSVGSVVVQLAKLAGLKVIASTGDDKKVTYLRHKLKADVAFNYKTTDTRDVLREHGPVDVYFDNVGGAHLDAALEFSAVKGRIISCGYVSEYGLGEGEPYGIKHMQKVLTRSLSINGFIIFDMIKEYGLEPFEKEFMPLLASGAITYEEHVTRGGLEKMGEALLGIYSGENIGKAFVVIAEE